MADVIRMPLLSDTMTEGKIATWNKKVGDQVKADDSLADVETDKATMEVIPYVDGTLLYIGVDAGQAAKVNDIIAIIGKPGEDISAYLAQPKATTAVVEPQVIEAEKPVATTPQSTIELPKDLTVIRMPLLSDTMTEGKIVTWNKEVGDSVKADDSLADVETDKATMEVVGYADGTLLYRGIEAGQAAKINEVIAIIGKAGTDITPYLPLLQSNEQNTPAASVVSTEAQSATQPKPEVIETAAAAHSNDRVKASPLAKSIAREKGIDLRTITGSGDHGRIVKRDLDQVAASASKTQAAATSNNLVTSGNESHTDIPVTQMRKIIAQRLAESKFSAPHFYLKNSVQLDNLINLRKQINAGGGVKISINDMIIKAVASSLLQHPEVNSSWMGDTVRQHHHVHIGSALALPEGLIVPVIKFAHQKTLSQIATEAASLYDKAKNKKIQPFEFTGNTFTISNLGMMDIDEFTAIINPPDACILAVGKAVQTPVVENNAIVIRTILKLTLSCDHRVVDGAVGAAFLRTLKGYLENPVTMLI